ncbi:outer membrane lipoprotein-sorting protein [Candidatus Margulisiibacteriota bacterium]
MKKFIITLLIYMLFSTATYSLTVTEILQKSDDIMRGKTSISELEMIVKTKRWTRTVKMKTWSKGTKKSFIKITYPSRDKGITFLKLDTEMWQYVPKIERQIKIPPSMMLQSWMGSDFTNDDLVKESSIVEDYDSKLLSEGEIHYEIELIPKPESAVVWGKIIYYVDVKTFLPVKEEFYDEDGELINILTFSDVKKFNDRLFPSKMVMIPQTEDKKGNSTTIIFRKMQFNVPIRNSIFTLQSLKTMSK